MSLNASKIESTSNFKKAEALEPGAYPARVVQILSLGLQPQRAFQGEDKPPKPEIYVTYELLDEFMLDEDGNEVKDKPRWISERIPMHSLDSDLAASTKRYYALDPENNYGGDWAKLISVTCMVTITNYVPKTGKNAGVTRDKVYSVSSMRAKDAEKAGDLVNPPKLFDIDDPDMVVFKSLPEWLQKVMTEDNLEFKGSALETAINNFEDSGELKENKKDQKDEKEDDSSDDEDW